MVSSLALARHLIDRTGYGPRPGDLERIAALGADHWLEQQLDPATISLPSALQTRLAGFATLRLTPPEIFTAYGPPSFRVPGQGKLTQDEIKERNRHFQFVAQEAIDSRLLRALESPRQLEEGLSSFWCDHFNVFIGKGLDRLWLGAYVEEAIRPHCLGRFRDLLGATAKHAAMLFFLDNWLNTAPGSPGARGQFAGINENFAREVMELHTLGVEGGYTQADVIALARILTGWTIGPLPRRPGARPGGGNPFFPVFRRLAPPPIAARGAFVFDADRHDFTDKHFLGRLIRGAGQAEGEEALDMLARSPATARHVSFQLARYFLADNPDKAVVAAMAKTFQASDGNIRAVLRMLFASPAFRDPAGFGTKFKTPYRFVVSAVRAAGLPVTNFRPLEGTLNQLGQRVYGCLTPDGYKNTQAAWLNPDAMVRRISFAVALAGGHMPLGAPPTGPLPAPPPPAAPLDAAALGQTLGDLFTPQTRAALDAAPPPVRAALTLGSPDFMHC